MRKFTTRILLLLGAAGGQVATGFAKSADLRIVRETFRKWSAAEGSLFDAMADDAVIIIPGTAPHCGSFSKSTFTRDMATPFMARFSRRPVPQARKFWCNGGDVVVLADAEGTRRDGKPYANSYVFILTLRHGCIVRATEFLDMAAFNDVWDHVAAAPIDTRVGALQ